MLIATLLATLVLTANCGPGSETLCLLTGKYLAPCTEYFNGQETNPDSTCCASIGQIKGMLQTKEDTKALCDCLENVIFKSGVSSKRFNALPTCSK